MNLILLFVFGVPILYWCAGMFQRSFCVPDGWMSLLYVITSSMYDPFCYAAARLQVELYHLQLYAAVGFISYVASMFVNARELFRKDVREKVEKVL